MSLYTKSEKNGVVLDANIIISAALTNKGAPYKIFKLLAKKKIVNYTSRTLILDIKEVLDRQGVSERIDQKTKARIVYAYQNRSFLIRVNQRPNVVKNDPDDDEIIAIACIANAEFIVTGDKHLLDIQEHNMTKIIKPKEFLDIYNKEKRHHFP